VDSGNIGKNDIHDPRNRRSTSPHSTFTKGSIEDFTLDDPELGSDLPLIFNGYFNFNYSCIFIKLKLNFI
jgi:hypothetical protein